MIENDEALFTDHESRLARFARAMGHPARIRIVQLLLESEQPLKCGEIVERLPLAQSTVSQHLRGLVETGIVVMTSEIPVCYYTLDRSQLLGFCRNFQIAMGNPPPESETRNPGHPTP
mgnify:FL=1